MLFHIFENEMRKCFELRRNNASKNIGIVVGSEKTNRRIQREKGNMNEQAWLYLCYAQSLLFQGMRKVLVHHQAEELEEIQV